MPDTANTESLQALAKWARQVEELTARVNALETLTTYQGKLIAGVRRHNLELLDDVKKKNRQLQEARLALPEVSVEAESG